MSAILNTKKSGGRNSSKSKAGGGSDVQPDEKELNTKLFHKSFELLTKNYKTSPLLSCVEKMAAEMKSTYEDVETNLKVAKRHGGGSGGNYSKSGASKTKETKEVVGDID